MFQAVGAGSANRADGLLRLLGDRDAFDTEVADVLEGPYADQLTAYQIVELAGVYAGLGETNRAIELLQAELDRGALDVVARVRFAVVAGQDLGERTVSGVLQTL